MGLLYKLLGMIDLLPNVVHEEIISRQAEQILEYRHKLRVQAGKMSVKTAKINFLEIEKNHRVRQIKKLTRDLNETKDLVANGKFAFRGVGWTPAAMESFMARNEEEHKKVVGELGKAMAAIESMTVKSDKKDLPAEETADEFYRTH